MVTGCTLGFGYVQIGSRNSTVLLYWVNLLAESHVKKMGLVGSADMQARWGNKNKQTRHFRAIDKLLKQLETNELSSYIR